MAGGVCNTGISGTNMFIEIIHLLLVIWNIYTDFGILFEMQSTSNTYDQYVDTIATSSKDYEYTFCYPSNHVPYWYINIDNETAMSCDCIESSFECDNDQKYNISSPDISCEPQIFGSSQPCQQTLYINHWICQECECNSDKLLPVQRLYSDISIYSDKSLPVQRLYYEYNTMSDIGYGYEYCDPFTIIDGKLSTENHLEILIKCSIAFLVIGIITWCGSTCGRGFVLVWDEVKDYIHVTDEAIENGGTGPDEDQKTYEHEAKLLLAATRMGFGFFANMFHDIPHQVLLLLYVKFLYEDYGFICFQDFVNGPKLNQVTFNTNEDLLVILARNYPIFSSVFAWSALVLFNAGWNTYQTYIEFDGATRAGAHTILKDAKQAKCIGKCLFYFALTLFFFIYILSHWCWPAFVAYYIVAPALHKEWWFAKVIFWGGVWIWGILAILIIIGIFVLFGYCIKCIINSL